MSSNKKVRPRYRDKIVLEPPRVTVLNNNFKDALLGNKSLDSKNFDAAWPKLNEKPVVHSRPAYINVKHYKVLFPSVSPACSGRRDSEEVSNSTANDEQNVTKTLQGQCLHEEIAVETKNEGDLFLTDFPSLNDSICKKKYVVKEIKNVGCGINKITITPLADEAVNMVTNGIATVNLSTTSGNSLRLSPGKPKPQLKHRINIDVNEALQIAASKKLKNKACKKPKPKILTLSGNRLDSDKPVRKKGKVRAVPKKKLLSKIKKAIILSRLKRLSSRNYTPPEPQENLEIDLRVKLQVDLEKSTQDLTKIIKKVKAVEPCAATNTIDVENEVKLSIHTKKFRTYCNNIPSPQLVNHVKNLVTTLRTFQDKLHNRDPDKAKRKRRYVCGFKETIKFLHLGNIRIIILATNLEACVGDPLEKMIEELKAICKTSCVPIAFAGTAYDLGYWTCKKNRISIIGVLNHQGCEDVFKDLLECLEEAQKDYDEKVRITRHSLGIKASDDSKKDVEELIKRSMLDKLTEGSNPEQPTLQQPMKREDLVHFSSFLESVEKCIRNN